MKGIDSADHLVKTREVLFISLYEKAFPTVARYIARRGGSFEEAKDVFQDALVVYYERSVKGNLSADNETAYLVGTAKHLWIKRYRENEQTTQLDKIEITIAVDESPAGNRLMHFLERSGKKCMELLRSFYYDDVPLADIASTYGYSGVRSATVQKYKCLEKVRETIKQKALVYEDFME